MFSSLRFRLWLTYSLVVGVVLVVAGAAIFVYLLRNPVEDRREVQRLRLLSTILVQRSQLLDVLPRDFSDERIMAVLKRADNAVGARVALFSETGQLIADSRADILPQLPDWNYFTQRREGLLPVFRDAEGMQWIYALTPLEGGNYLLLAAPSSRKNVLGVLRDEFLTPFIRGAAIALVLALLLAFWIAHWITKPLRGMTEAARAVSHGEYRKIPPAGGPKEVQELTHAFNDMVSRVQASQRSQRDFIANVSHDLKTPLTSIQGYAQAILDGTVESGEDIHKAAEVIRSEAARMNRMVLDLLELARLDSGVASFEKKSVDLQALLSFSVDKFQPVAREAEVHLTFQPGESLQGTLPRMIGDPDRLTQVFGNLIDNALKFSPRGGEVSVGMEVNQNWAEIMVADEGPGIPEDELERIFERFYQTDKSRRGGDRRSVGLGLAIAHEIVRAHGGTIRAFNRHSTQGSPHQGAEKAHGAVFVVRLPLVGPEDTTVVHRRDDDRWG